jgi:hypothetical protein
MIGIIASPVPSAPRAQFTLRWIIDQPAVTAPRSARSTTS